jgi:ABC-type transport system involved in cytochrome c biogenesis permease subunit
MEIKYTPQGYMIYSVMATYFLAFIAFMARKMKLGQLLYGVGFLIAIAAFIYRWINVGHVPMQNLFEVFLTLGMVIWPITVFCRKFLDVGGERWDVLIGFFVLFPAGFVFHADPQQLPPALQCWLFSPHVAVYMLSYMIMAKATVQAVCQLSGGGVSAEGSVSYEQATYRMVCFGFPLLTLGLVLGSWWGKLAWGDYWGWDPKELWSLVSWLVYVAYLHWRYTLRRKMLWTNSVWAILGMVAIVITLLWVNLSKIFPGMHNYAS